MTAVKQIFALKTVPSRASLRNVERPEIGDRTTCEQARKLAAGMLAPSTVLATIDIRSDSFPTIAIDRGQLAAIKKVAHASEVALVEVPPARPRSTSKKAEPRDPHVSGKSFDLPFIHPYAGLVRRWEEPAELGPLADYHLESLTSSSNNDFFGYCSLMPVELVAIRAVRDREGLETRWPENHPLVTNPIGHAFLERPRSTFDATKDPIFKALVAYLTKEALLPARLDPFRA